MCMDVCWVHVGGQVVFVWCLLVERVAHLIVTLAWCIRCDGRTSGPLSSGPGATLTISIMSCFCWGLHVLTSVATER
jgi:hypothetical protein